LRYYLPSPYHTSRGKYYAILEVGNRKLKANVVSSSQSPSRSPEAVIFSDVSSSSRKRRRRRRRNNYSVLLSSHLQSSSSLYICNMLEVLSPTLYHHHHYDDKQLSYSHSFRIHYHITFYPSSSYYYYYHHYYYYYYYYYQRRLADIYKETLNVTVANKETDAQLGTFSVPINRVMIGRRVSRKR